jgi:peptidoglycan/xylan/chitin deacetylase (PgdA/CDA1 family)
MKIIILNKKILFFICLFCIIFSSLFFYLTSPFSFAVELTTNSIIDDSLKEKITSLTKQEEKIAYLTFDDGPTLKATAKILDILKEEDIKATFFVVGKHVKEHPELVKRAYEEGHYIANHGYTHDNSKLYTNSDSFISEIKNTDIEIGNAIGVENYCSHIFRFPNGYMSSNNKAKKKEAITLLSDINYTYIDWNCLNNDSVKKYSKYQLLNNLKKSSKNKGTLVVLMHDTSDVNDTPSILKDSINYLKEQGYEFRNFYDLLD